MTTIKVVGFEKGGITADIKDSPAIRYDVDVQREEARRERFPPPPRARRSEGSAPLPPPRKAPRGEDPQHTPRSGRPRGRGARVVARAGVPRGEDAATRLERDVAGVEARLAAAESAGLPADEPRAVRAQRRFGEGARQYALGDWLHAALMLTEAVDEPEWAGAATAPTRSSSLADALRRQGLSARPASATRTCSAGATAPPIRAEPSPAPSTAP